MKLIVSLVAAAWLASAPSIVAAQSGHGEHGTASTPNPVIAAFEQANEKMMQDMMVAPTGDADVDFVRMMIPHHQGAIDMARIELDHGKSQVLRDMAQQIITAQEAEIAVLQQWLKDHGEAQ